MIRSARRLLGCACLAWLTACGEADTNQHELGTAGLPFEDAHLSLRSADTSGKLEDDSFEATLDREHSEFSWVIFQIGGSYALSGSVHAELRNCREAESDFGEEECDFSLAAPTLEVVAKADWSDPYADGATVAASGDWTGHAYLTDGAAYVEGPAQTPLLEFRTATSQTTTRYAAEGLKVTLDDSEFSLDATLTRVDR